VSGTERQKLEQRIRKRQDLLNVYETSLRLETDPHRMQNLLDFIEEVKKDIRDAQATLAELRTETGTAHAGHTGRESKFIFNVPYSAKAAFVGREDERLILDDWFDNDVNHPLMAVIGIGGAGKSALVWDWVTKLGLDARSPSIVVWWSFYERKATVSDLTARVLNEYFGDTLMPSDPDDQVRQFLERIGETQTLLVLDGVERLLRAYYDRSENGGSTTDGWADGLHGKKARECVAPGAKLLLTWLAQPGLTKARTLITSRLFPQELAGPTGAGLYSVRRHDITGLDQQDAFQLFTNLGIRTTLEVVAAVSEPVGYHPLSLLLLAGYVADNPDLADNNLLAAVDYDPIPDLRGRQQHILSRAYENLSPEAQFVLTGLAGLQGSISWNTIKTHLGDSEEMRAHLNLLHRRGLLTRVKYGGVTIYDFHPVVRRYAVSRVAGVEMDAEHGRFSDLPAISLSPDVITQQGNEQRFQQLQVKIQDELKLLSEYEELESNARDPRDRRHYRKEIERQRTTLKALQTELDALAGVLSVPEAILAGQEQTITDTLEDIQTINRQVDSRLANE
jgi:hypothetical protein